MNGLRSTSRLVATVCVGLMAAAAGAVETTEGVASLANPEGRGTARVMGMDASYVGVAEGADALQWNPAGLGNLRSAEAGWHHLSGLGSSVGESVIVGAPLGGLGGLAISAEMLDNGEFETRDSQGNVSGQYDARTLGGSLGWGYAIMPALAVGATGRAARQTLGDMHFDSFAVDAGVLWRAVPALAVGAAVSNLGGSGSESDLAMGLNLGASWHQAVGAEDHVLLACATEIQPGGLSHLNVGGEGTFMSHLALRAGYRFNFADQQLNGLTGLTAGVGISISHVALDYAYVPFGELGNLHRISLTFRMAATSQGRLEQEGS